MDRLSEDTSGAENKIKLLHRVAVVGSVDESGEKISGGEYRDCAVGFGAEYIAPHANDIPKLMAAFTQKLEELSIAAQTEDDVNLIATWAHVNLIGIHPFEDGNGRTARSLVEYTRYARFKDLGIEYTPMSLPGSGIYDDNTFTLFEACLQPTRIGLPEKDLATGDVDLYFQALSRRNRLEQYYSTLKENISKYIQDSNSIQSLREIEAIALLSEKLQRIDDWTTGYETKSLKGLEIIERAEEIF